MPSVRWPRSATTAVAVAAAGCAAVTEKARLVLADCEDELRELAGAHEAGAHRRRWFGCLALLRAVGHVLDKVDGTNDAQLAPIIAVHYENLKATRPAIFWDFIEDERNLVIKTYSMRARRRASAAGARTLTTAADPRRPDLKPITVEADQYGDAHITQQSRI